MHTPRTNGQGHDIGVKKALRELKCRKDRGFYNPVSKHNTTYTFEGKGDRVPLSSNAFRDYFGSGSNGTRESNRPKASDLSPRDLERLAKGYMGKTMRLTDGIGVGEYDMHGLPGYVLEITEFGERTNFARVYDIDTKGKRIRAIISLAHGGSDIEVRLADGAGDRTSRDSAGSRGPPSQSGWDAFFRSHL